MNRTLRILQWTLIGLGLALIGVFIASLVHREIGSRSAMRDFEAAREAARAAPSPSPTVEPTPTRVLPDSLPVDTSLWAQGRIEEYNESLSHDFAPPLAILRIPKIGLEVPVLDGTDDLTLNRAVGRIAGTATVETMGNLGIAGHRDGYFRGLKDVAVGDLIELETLTGELSFTIEKISIVNPTDVHVLAPTERPTITLVGCYPFYFVGKAPQRYIVRATLRDSGDV
jgi:LPXTG-site transpeptidase (sortase) family protein